MSNNYTFSFHFPDKSVSISKFVKNPYSQAIPNQENPVWSPYTAQPNTHAYADLYMYEGFAWLQSLLAYQILANHVNDSNAWISFLFQPLLTDNSENMIFTT